MQSASIQERTKIRCLHWILWKIKLTHLQLVCANIIKLSIIHSLNLFCVYIQTHLEKWGPAGPRTKSPTNGTWRETTRERRTQFSCESIVSRSRHFVETIIQPFISLDTYRVELLTFDIDFCIQKASTLAFSLLETSTTAFKFALLFFANHMFFVYQT